jgi:hypothetical protein
MKKSALFLFAGIVSSGVIASDDCREPAENWQPIERLEQLMNESKWQVKRIKVDDGCYEVDGQDPQGNEIEAKFSPATLLLKKFEVKFKGDKKDGPAYYGQLKDIAYFKQ